MRHYSDLVNVRSPHYMPDLIDCLARCGFGDLTSSLAGVARCDASHILEAGLLEWWWDTTNSFHFPWGELTVTPLDYSVIFGLCFTNRLVSWNAGIIGSQPRTRRLLGPICGTLPSTEYVPASLLA